MRERTVNHRWNIGIRFMYPCRRRLTFRRIRSGTPNPSGHKQPSTREPNVPNAVPLLRALFASDCGPASSLA